MVAAREHCRARRRAESGRVETGVLQSLCREALRRRRLARTAERARRAKADIIEQDDEHVRGASWRTQLSDRRELRIRVFRVVGRQADWLAIRNRQYLPWDVVLARHRVLRLVALAARADLAA
jgi:hypothetical protein